MTHHKLPPGTTRKNAAHLPRKNVCDCGLVAVRKKCSTWICQRCLTLEARYYGTNRDGNKMSRTRHEFPANRRPRSMAPA